MDAKTIAISWPGQTTRTQPDHYKFFVNDTLKANQVPSCLATQTATITDLQPGVYTIRIEGWYQNELTSQGSASVTILKPEPVVLSPIEAKVIDAKSVAISWANQTKGTQPHHYKISSILTGTCGDFAN